jgi:hypothetical protein
MQIDGHGLGDGPNSKIANSVAISKMADDLALAIDKQWKDEFRFQGLNDPYPFQITWQSAPNSFAEGLDEVQDVANN